MVNNKKIFVKLKSVGMTLRLPVIFQKLEKMWGYIVMYCSSWYLDCNHIILISYSKDPQSRINHNYTAIFSN